MLRAVDLGYVTSQDAQFVRDGLRWGFTAGIDSTLMRGHRWAKNYKSALDFPKQVLKAINKRVSTGKTINIGLWTPELAHELRMMYDTSAIFSMGTVPKPLEPDAPRLISDHTKSGVNAASIVHKYTLTADADVSWFLRQGYFMRVSDVEGAFPILPLAPEVWPYFMFRFVSSLVVGAGTCLYMHLCGDFGAAGMPGTFHIFFTKVICGMARACQILTLPMAVYVDDCGLIGACAMQVDAEMTVFHEWASLVCGVIFKVIKDRLAAQRQLMIGFWWDSTTLTRSLETSKLHAYIDLLLEYTNRSTLTLWEMQSVAGKMQRAVLTFPPGASCLLTSIFQLTLGLKHSWQKRRTTQRVRADFNLVARLLQLNLGRGHYSYDLFKEAPGIRSDASKNDRYTGGGWVSQCGRYDLWRYGTRASKNMIDYLEGDVVTECTRQMAPLWKGCKVPFGVDNKAFQLSATKGRSSADRLNDLVRELFYLMLKHQFIFMFYWLSSKDNLLADLLSRQDGEGEFLTAAYTEGFWASDTVPQRVTTVGTVPIRSLPEVRGVLSAGAVEEAATEGKKIEAGKPTVCGTHNTSKLAAESREAKGGCSADDTQVKPKHARQHHGHRRGTRKRLIPALVTSIFLSCISEGEAMPVNNLQSTISYVRASIYSGLPSAFEGVMESVMDNRLSSSSWRTIESGLKHWRRVCTDQGWSPVIHTDDPHRGGKLAAFVLYLLDQTELVWGSIANYVWGVRTWQTLQFQADPIYGIMHWEQFMSAIKILAWVPHEPRKRFPTERVKKILDTSTPNDTQDITMDFLMLLLLFTYARTESPLPKSYTGRDCYDAMVHWNMQDAVLAIVDGVKGIWIRFRAIKQDPRCERPEAQRGGDWAWIADLPNSQFSIIQAYVRYLKVIPPNRAPTDSLFVDFPNQGRPLLYATGTKWIKERQTRFGTSDGDIATMHGLRVEGYNSTQAVLGEDIAAAHGGWKSDAHKRYLRFSMLMVSRIPGAIVGLEEPPEPLEERDAHVPSARVRRHGEGASTEGLAGPQEVLPDAGLRDEDGLVGPEGTRADSVNDACRSSMVAQEPRAQAVQVLADLASPPSTNPPRLLSSTLLVARRDLACTTALHSCSSLAGTSSSPATTSSPPLGAARSKRSARGRGRGR